MASSLSTITHDSSKISKKGSVMPSKMSLPWCTALFTTCLAMHVEKSLFENCYSIVCELCTSCFADFAGYVGTHAVTL